MQIGIKDFKVNSIQDILRKRGLDKGGAVQRYIDSEVLRLSDQYIPMDTGELKRSGVQQTVLGSGEVVYQTLYARKAYYTPANFAGAPIRGNYWFEKMKNAGGKDQILNGAIKMAGAK